MRICRSPAILGGGGLLLSLFLACVSTTDDTGTADSGTTPFFPAFVPEAGRQRWPTHPYEGDIVDARVAGCAWLAEVDQDDDGVAETTRSYAYDAAGELISVITDGTETDYAWEAGCRTSSMVVDELMVRETLAFTCDAAGHDAHVVGSDSTGDVDLYIDNFYDAGGWALAGYDDNSDGHSEEGVFYRFDGVKAWTATVEYPMGVPSETWTWTWTNGAILSQRDETHADARWNLNTWSYDDAGRVLSRVYEYGTGDEPASGRNTTTWTYSVDGSARPSEAAKLWDGSSIPEITRYRWNCP